MMLAKCLGLGLRAASKRPVLISLLWMINLALGLLAAIPAWTWWRDSFSYAPAADTLLNGFNFAAYFDLAHYNRSSVSSLLNVNVMALVIVAGVLGALLFGGTLEILRAGDSRPFMHRFFRGAGHFFWRFLRVTIYNAVGAAIVVGLVLAALAPLLKPLEDSAWEPGWVVAFAIRFVLIGFLLLFFFLVLDYARIRVAVDDTRRAFRTWLASLGFALCHVPGTCGITIAYGVLLGVLLGLYFGFCGVSPANTRELILLLVIVQQIVMWLRAGLRVAHIGAEVEFFERVRPAFPVITSAAVAPPAVEMGPDVVGPAEPGAVADQGTPASEAPPAQPQNHEPM